MSGISERLSMAVHAALALAAAPGVFVPGGKIAERCGFSRHHLAKVLGLLVRAGVAEAQRGSGGGARLARSAREITLADLRDAVERAAPRKTPCLLPRAICPGNRCAVGRMLAENDARIKAAFAETTLADVLRSMETAAKTTNNKETR